MPQINNAVIVDMKLAFQHNEDWLEENYGVEPDYPLLVDGRGKEYDWHLSEISVRGCSHNLCRNGDCPTRDAYVSLQKSHARGTLRKVNQSVENFELGVTRSELEVQRCKDELKTQELLILLPGSVAGFSLRSRRWGMILSFRS